MSDRIDDLEHRLEAIERLVHQEPPQAPETAGRFWALDALREQTTGTPGGVMFAGTWQPGDDPDTAAQPSVSGGVEWQYGRPISYLLELDWTMGSNGLAALGHPMRLTLLRHILTGTTSTKALAEIAGLGTTGQLHHHLRTLVAAGWLRQQQRGDYEVPDTRVVPLLVILTAIIG